MAQRISTSSNGFALIISNDYSTNCEYIELTGTKVDAQAMDKAFKELKFDTLCEQNVDRGRFMQLVCETARCTNYPRNCKCIALVFSGHGRENNCLIMQDGGKVQINEIVEQLLPLKAPALGNIPKLFFLDACRGLEQMHAVTVPRGAGAKHEVLQKGGSSMATLQVPAEGNFLLAYSTMPSYKAYEMHGKGGIWMTTLAERLQSSRKSVDDILSLVNEDLIRIYNHPDSPEWKGRMQQPEKISRLNKVVYLHPEAAADDAPGVPPGANASQPGLGRSNSQEAGLYRGLLNQKNQTKEISKLDYQTLEHKEGKISLGFTSVVSFETPTGVKQFQSPQMESSKPIAQERAAEQAWKWLDLRAPVAAQNSAGSTQIPGYGVFPRQLQSPPKREAISLPQANVTNASQPGLGRSNSQEAGLYRGLLNQKHQTKEILKLDYQTLEHKDGKISLGFTSVVSFETPTGVKQFQSPQMESSKPIAQERAAERAWKWLDLRAPVAAQTIAGETQIPGHGGFPRQLQSPPKREVNSLPRTNVTAIPTGVYAPTSHSPTVAASPGKLHISKLKELCDKRVCGDPVYVELGEQFQFKVTVKSLRPVIAVGEVCSSKKDAKHSAAQKALQKLGM